VCTHWHAAAARTITALQPRLSQSHLEQLPTSFPSVSSLDLSRCSKQPATTALTALSTWLRGTGNRRAAAGAGKTSLDPAQLGKQLARLPRLHTLQLGSASRLAAAGDDEHDGEGDDDDDSGCLDRPIGFVFATDACLHALQPLAPQLRTLDLSGSVQVSDAGLLGMTRLSRLRELLLRRCVGVSDAGLIAVAQLQRLTRLDVAGCPQVGCRLLRC